MKRGRKPLNRYHVLINYTATFTVYANARDKVEAKRLALKHHQNSHTTKKYREITITRLSKDDPEYR
jgi:hypothetical protein